MEKRRCTAIVLAAGSGRRMGGKIQKQFLELNGKPVVCHSLSVFQQSPLIDDIILVTGAEQISYCREEIVKKYSYTKVTAVVAGGAERYLSVWEGLKAMPDGSGIGHKVDSYVFIHDGARPFVTEEILGRAYPAVQQSLACVVGMLVKDTIMIADEEGCAANTPERRLVCMIQTPQVFSFSLIKEAYARLIAEGRSDVTDDAMVVESMTDCKVKLVEGSYSNIKLTTPEDLKLAMALSE